MTIPSGPRQPLKPGFRLSVNTLPSTPPWVIQATDEALAPPVEGFRENATMKVQLAWRTVGRGDGGAILDQTLTDLGQSYAENGRVTWIPPEDLDAALIDYLAASVGQLNQLIAEGVMEVTEEGTIRPRQPSGDASSEA